MTKIHQLIAGSAVALLTLVAMDAQADYALSCAGCHAASNTPEVNFLPNGTGTSGSIRAANNYTYLNTKIIAGMGGGTTSGLSAATRMAIASEIGSSASVAAPVFTSAAAPGGTVTVFYSHTFTASGAPTLVGNAGLSSPFTLNTGTLPSGVLLNGATGVLSGTPTAGGTYSGTVRASNLIGAGPTQAFSITIARLSQATLTALLDGSATPPAKTFGTTGVLSTSGGSGGGAVTYGSSNMGVCSIAGTTLTAAGVGSCTITATKAQDATYNATSDNFTLTVNQAPQTITFGALASKLTTSPPFTVSATGGASGNPVTFTASGVCTSGGTNGTTITLTGAAGMCTVTANQAGNANYAAAAPVPRAFTVATPNSFVSVASRKVHGAAGPFDLPINTSVALAGAVTVESRVIGAGHLIVFKFSNNVSVAGTAVVSVGTGMVTSVVAVLNEVRVTVTGVPNNSRALISLNGVDGSINAAAPVGFRVGDANSDRIVSSTDVTASKARSAQTTDNSNFTFDVNMTGFVTAADIAAAKARIDLTPIP